MGWWEQESSQWKVCVIAQLGAAAIGGGVFFMQFMSPDIPVEPVFIFVATGVGIGGSIGSSATMPWAEMIRCLADKNYRPDTDSLLYNDLQGTFSCRTLNHSLGTFFYAGASAAVLGASFGWLTALRPEESGPGSEIFRQKIAIPKTLRQIKNAAINTPQIQGAFGLGGFGFSGLFQYLS